MLGLLLAAALLVIYPGLQLTWDGLKALQYSGFRSFALLIIVLGLILVAVGGGLTGIAWLIYRRDRVGQWLAGLVCAVLALTEAVTTPHTKDGVVIVVFCALVAGLVTALPTARSYFVPDNRPAAVLAASAATAFLGWVLIADGVLSFPAGLIIHRWLIAAPLFLAGGVGLLLLNRGLRSGDQTARAVVTAVLVVVGCYNLYLNHHNAGAIVLTVLCAGSIALLWGVTASNQHFSHQLAWRPGEEPTLAPPPQAGLPPAAMIAVAACLVVAVVGAFVLFGTGSSTTGNNDPGVSFSDSGNSNELGGSSAAQPDQQSDQNEAEPGDQSTDSSDSTDSSADGSTDDTSTDDSSTDDSSDEASAVARSLDNLLTESGEQRVGLVQGIADVQDCSDVVGGQSAIAATEVGRAGELAQLQDLDLSSIDPDGQLKQLLTTALTLSQKSDAAYARWASHVSTGCTTHASASGTAWSQATAYGKQATSIKNQIVPLWNAIADQYGLQERSEQDI